jgi:hypothetical protein
LEGLAMEDVGILNGHFVYFTSKWYILWPFGKFCGHLVQTLPHFGILYREISGNPALAANRQTKMKKNNSSVGKIEILRNINRRERESDISFIPTFCHL